MGLARRACDMGLIPTIVQGWPLDLLSPASSLSPTSSPTPSLVISRPPTSQPRETLVMSTHRPSTLFRSSTNRHFLQRRAFRHNHDTVLGHSPLSVLSFTIVPSTTLVIQSPGIHSLHHILHTTPALQHPMDHSLQPFPEYHNYTSLSKRPFIPTMSLPSETHILPTFSLAKHQEVQDKFTLSSKPGSALTNFLFHVSSLSFLSKA
jgi:hypothetical protein